MRARVCVLACVVASLHAHRCECQSTHLSVRSSQPATSKFCTPADTCTQACARACTHAHTCAHAHAWRCGLDSQTAMRPSSCACVHACVRACVCACVHACVCALARVRMAHMCACVQARARACTRASEQAGRLARARGLQTRGHACEESSCCLHPSSCVRPRHGPARLRARAHARSDVCLYRTAATKREALEPRAAVGHGFQPVRVLACVRACVRASARACARAVVRAPVHACMCVHACAPLHVDPRVVQVQRFEVYRRSKHVRARALRTSTTQQPVPGGAGAKMC